MRAVGWSARRPRVRRVAEQTRAGALGLLGPRGQKEARGGRRGEAGGWVEAGFRPGIAALLSVVGARNRLRPESHFVFGQTTGLVGLAVCETPHEVGASGLAVPSRSQGRRQPLFPEGHRRGHESGPESQLLLSPGELVRCHNYVP